MATDSRPTERRQAGWRPMLFAVLLAGFGVRVATQTIQQITPAANFLTFHQQQSPLPYALLLASEAVIIAAGAWALWAMWTGRPEPQPRLGRVMVWVGWIYLVGAAFRFFAGLTFLPSTGFFDGPLPGFFHIVLAGMVLTFAAHLADEARTPAGA